MDTLKGRRSPLVGQFILVKDGKVILIERSWMISAVSKKSDFPDTRAVSG